MKCANCKDPLNQFDIAFHKHFKFRKTEECSCVCCNTNSEVKESFIRCKELAKHAKKKKIASWLFFPPWALTVFSFLLLFMIFGADGDPMSTLFGEFLFNLLVISWCCAFGSGIILVGSFVKNRGTSEKSYSGSHYETTFNSDGTAVTQKVDDYSYSTVGREGPSGRMCVLLFFTSLIWGGPYCLRMLLSRDEDPSSKMYYKSISEKFTPEVADAYVKAYREVKDCQKIRKQIDTYIKNCKTRNPWGTYEAQKKEIIKKYSLLNQDAVNEKLKELRFPFIKIRFNGVCGILVWYERDLRNGVSTSTPWHKDKKSVKSYFIVYEANDGKMRGTILDHDYFLLLDDDWLEYFKNDYHRNSRYTWNRIPKEICDVLEEYKNDYHGLLKRI